MITAKKAQLSWFIVLSIVFLIILAIISWLAYSTQLISKKPAEVLSSENIVDQARSYIISCEEELVQEALILVGNHGGFVEPKTFFEVEDNRISIESFPSLEGISKDVSLYIDNNLASRCDASIVTKKDVNSSKPKTSITFNDKETVVDTSWAITLTLENNTKYIIDNFKFSYPVRFKKVHEAVLSDLKTPLTTDLNFVNSLDNMDFKKIKLDKKILNLIIDYKSRIKDKPYKFFYLE